MPSRPSMSPASFSVGHSFFFFKQNRSVGLMARSKRPYTDGVVTRRAVLCFIHSFLSLDSGLGVNITTSLQMIFQMPLKCQGPVQIRPLERWKQTHSVTFFLRVRMGCEFTFYHQAAHSISVSPVGQ